MNVPLLRRLELKPNGDRLIELGQASPQGLSVNLEYSTSSTSERVTSRIEVTDDLPVVVNSCSVSLLGRAWPSLRTLVLPPL